MSSATEGRAALARRIVETRVAVADAILSHLGPRSSGQASALLVRSLVSALGQSLEAASPEAVVSWARMAHGAFTLPVIHDLVASACEVTAATGEPLDLDFSALLVFLEIIKTNVAEAFPLAPGARFDDPQRATSGVIDGVLAMLKARDEATCAHSHATGAWCRRLSEAMGLSTMTTDVVVKAGVLHDVGKIATPDAILFKPGSLTEPEWIVMQQHAEFGAQILAELPALSAYAPIVRAHHERWDGRGYPYGLQGEQIPFEARVVAVADAFHAMISARPYRPAIAQREAMEILREGRGTQWDGAVVDAMIAMLDAPRSVGRREVARG
ncbi:MAG: HD-GYP domain-containing protein [Candidatus Eremiobacteraeota bacterium]|nr:HD-GYP domain-containing protein [Candidatus Eremiobacteraeota bacterium]